MKSQTSKDEVLHGKVDKLKVSKSSHNAKMKKQKNMNRLGGGGLSLEAFANIKSNNNQYNPALIKKQREFYKNAKYVSKYKRFLKHSSQQNDASVVQPLEDDNKNESTSKAQKKKKKGMFSLKKIYEKQHEEEAQARKEREAIIQAKKEEREKAEARRKTERQKMLKKTRSGQPVMKYRIEHLLRTIQGSNQP